MPPPRAASRGASPQAAAVQEEGVGSDVTVSLLALLASLPALVGS